MDKRVEKTIFLFLYFTLFFTALFGAQEIDALYFKF